MRIIYLTGKDEKMKARKKKGPTVTKTYRDSILL